MQYMYTAESNSSTSKNGGTALIGKCLESQIIILGEKYKIQENIMFFLYVAYTVIYDSRR